jgi:two-component system sensor histidine kinase QseC
MTWVNASHELDELLDGHLAQAAALLVIQQAKESDDDELSEAPALHKYAPRVAFQVFHEGRLVLRSANMDAQPMAELSRGFTTVRLKDDELWRIFATQGPEHDVQVFVAEQVASRSAILWAVLRSVLLPLVFALPVLALAGWWAVKRGLVPLRQISEVLGQRGPEELVPVVLENTPTEMQPLIQALNGLFDRIERLLESERRFTADAAHELRTPIAVIRTQAQVALGAGTDEEQRQHALRATLAGCDRASRLVDQLLILARLEVTAQAMDSREFDLGELVRTVMAELAPAALTRHQLMELNIGAPCSIQGNATLNAVMVRNLVDNAMRYSPDGARIVVTLAHESDQIMLQVEDSGPGMSEQEMARLGERFYRTPGQEQAGSGLGWSIVKRIGVVLRVQIQISRSGQLGGLAVSVGWPILETV